jgi:Domain of unknown function (DUF4328)
MFELHARVAGTAPRRGGSDFRVTGRHRVHAAQVLESDFEGFVGTLGWCYVPDVMSDDQDGAGLLPLRALANILTVLLAVVVVVIAARLAIQLLQPGSAHWRHSLTDLRLDKVADVTMFGLGILFVVWFRRARINAERHGYYQRRARGWTFWGWLIPIVNLWFPFQIMGDIWRAGLPAWRRGKTAWLPALWWLCWLLSGLSWSAQATAANSGPLPHIDADTRAFSLCFLALAGAILIAIIRTVSAGPVGSSLHETRLSSRELLEY